MQMSRAIHCGFLSSSEFESLHNQKSPTVSNEVLSPCDRDEVDLNSSGNTDFMSVLDARLSRRSVLRGGVGSAGVALLRLFGGLALKWLVIVGALYFALARWELPPLPLLAGLGAALAAFLLGFRIKS